MTLANGSNALSVTGVEQIGSSDSSGSSDDTLTLLNNVSGVGVALFNGTNALNLAEGVNSLTHLSSIGTVTGSGGDDTLSITSIFNNGNATTIDLGGGTDTLNLGTNFVDINAVGVEQINGDGAGNFVVLRNNQSGTSIDLGDGSDSLIVADGANTLAAVNVEQINASDLSTGSSNDSLTLLNNVSGVNVHLGAGTNSLHLAGGVNSLNHITAIGTISGGSGSDSLTIAGTMSNNGNPTVIDLGGGTDTVSFGTNAHVSVVNVETVNGSASNDVISIGGGATTVTGGLGNDNLTAGSGADNFRYTSTADSAGPVRDFITGFDASADVFTFSGMGFASAINFVGLGPFTGTGSQARISGGSTLEIDVNGDAIADMQIELSNIQGTLTNANFVVEGLANQAPTDIALSNATVAENSAVGAVVGALSSTDPDAGDSATYTLLDNAGGRFAVSGGNLVVAGLLDYEAATSHAVTVRVTDSAGHTFDEVLTVNVSNVNEAPTDIALVGTSVVENSAAGTVVGTLSSSRSGCG